jgi:sugar lactone lactonase YvrE
MRTKRIKPVLVAVTLISILSFVFIQAHNAFSEEGKKTKLYRSEILATFPPGTFLENLVWDKEGNLYITNNSTGVILKYSYVSNSVSEFAKTGGNPFGIAIDHDGTIYVGAVRKPLGSPGFMDSNAIYKIDKQGNVSLFMDVPKARLLNGWLYVKPGIFLICDAYGGAIWKLDVKNATLTEWLRNDLLATKNIVPGANGIKFYKNFAFVSSSSQEILLRITMDENGNAVKTEVYRQGVNLDDFCISEDGNIYATTHPANVVLLIKEKGKPEIIAAGEEDGVRGNTAAIFGQNKGDDEWIYVIGDGGLWEGREATGGKTIDQSKLKPAALTRIYVGEKGYDKK